MLNERSMYGQNIFSNFLLTGLSTDETQNESTQCTAQLLLELPISDYKFDSTITSLTMPNGLMYTQHFTSATKFHSFIGIKADGVKFYGGSLVFFEPVSENIAKRIQHYLIGKSSKQLTNAVKLGDTESVLIDISGSECDQKDSVSTDVLSDIYDLESHLSSIKTSDSGISLLDLHNGPNNLFVTKSISLISNQPLNSSFEQILIGLYQIYEKGKNRNDIKIALYNLLYECKFYPAQSISIMEDFLTEHVFVYFPGEGEFSMIDFDLIIAMNMVSIADFIMILVHVLLDSQILLISEDPNKLVLMAEALCICMYPFNWHFTYVPIVPSTILDLLDSPIPYIMGIKLSDVAAIPQAGQFCVVYLDDGRVSYTRKVAGLPFADELIDELNESITKRWSSYNLSRKYSLAFQHDQYTAAKRRILVNTLTQELILNSLAQNLINFENFINKSKVNENFDRYGFLRQCPKSRYKFVSQLTLSQIFANFIDSYSDQNNLKTDFSIFQSRLKSLSKLPREDNNYISASYVLDTEHDTITNLTNPVKHTPYFDFNCQYNDPYENEISAFMFLVECPEFKESTGVITEVNDPFLTGRRLSVDSRMLSTDVACSRILQECKNRCQQLVSKLSIERTTEEQQESSIVDNICNLIEMIWAHGFKIEKVKSPLWYHLTHYNLIEFYATNNFPVDDIDVKYGIRWCIQRRRKRYQESLSSSVNLSEIESNIDKLDCFSTESEKSQVLVSYCMEYGIITLLFTQLLSNSDLLTALYRKDSIIRDSDGREKILMYTQILTIRKFRYFSSKISDTKIPYNLKIFGKRSKKSTKVTICLYGTTGTTGEITITEDRNSLTFLCRSIGDLIFMSLRYLKIGSLVDVEKITINQQLTRQHCIFNCKRFITHKGKIGATSSFIVPAYVISSNSVNNEDILNPNAKTKVIPERLNSLTNSYVEDTELRDRLWYAVTECCQLLSSEEARSGSYFYFFIQINGICHHFESILSDGLKSPLFQKKYLWDAITAYLQVNHVISRSQDLVTTKTRSSSTRSSRKSFGSTNSLNITNCIHIINDYFDQFDCSMRFKLWMLLSWRMLYLKKSLIILGHFLRTSKQYQADAFIRQIDGLSFICQEAGRLESVKAKFDIPILSNIIDLFE